MAKLNFCILRSLLFKQHKNDTGSKKDGVPGEGAPPPVLPPPAPPLPAPLSPSEPCRSLLPPALFLMTFFAVMLMLLVYMDTTAMRQQQFRLNMSREYELGGVSQDAAELVAYIRQWQLASGAAPFPPHTHTHRHTHAPAQQQPQQSNTPLHAQHAQDKVAALLNLKRNGMFVEIGAYGPASNGLSRTEWLERSLGWRGLLVTPDARDYFRLRAARTTPHTLAMHACLSTSTHPKEITYQESSTGEEVGVLALGGGAAEEFTARVKCFPLYSILLAARADNADFLTIACNGCQLAALSSLPADKVHISIIEIVGKQVPGIGQLMNERGYKVAYKTSDSTLYALRSIPTLKI